MRKESKIKSVLGGLAASLRGVFRRSIRHEPLHVPKAVLNTRLSICKKCDSYASKMDTCMECFCLLRIKASLRSEACPLAKWPVMD